VETRPSCSSERQLQGDLFELGGGKASERRHLLIKEALVPYGVEDEAPNPRQLNIGKSRVWNYAENCVSDTLRERFYSRGGDHKLAFQFQFVKRVSDNAVEHLIPHNPSLGHWPYWTRSADDRN
jgi:hypothetical protein